MKGLLGTQDGAGQMRGHLQPPSWLTKGPCLHPHTQKLKGNENPKTSRRIIPTGRGQAWLSGGDAGPAAECEPPLGTTGRPKPGLEHSPSKTASWAWIPLQCFPAYFPSQLQNFRDNIDQWSHSTYLKYRSTNLSSTFILLTMLCTWEMLRNCIIQKER